MGLADSSRPMTRRYEEIVMTTSGELCSRSVVFVERDSTVELAAQLMRRHHVGTVVVVDDTKGARVPVGIITDRDIVIEVNAAGLDQNAITVGDIMAPELVTVREDDDLLHTLGVMRYNGLRRLPVVDGSGSLAGIISIDDVLEVFSEQMAEMARALRREREHEIRSRA
jgi:CBS domain-containing protein